MSPLATLDLALKVLNATMPKQPETKQKTRYDHIADALSELEVPNEVRTYVNTNFIPAVQHLSRKASTAKKRHHTLSLIGSVGLWSSSVLTGLGGTLGLEQRYMVGGSFVLTSVAALAGLIEAFKHYRATHERSRYTAEQQIRQFWRFQGLAGVYRGLDRTTAAWLFVSNSADAFDDESAAYFVALAADDGQNDEPNKGEG